MEELGKAPVVVRLDVPGFVVNRLQYALLREAYALVDAGVCTFEDVDRAVTAGLGARWAAIGPFQTMDLAGLDVHAAVAENLWPELATTSRPSRSIEAARERGSIRADFDAEELKARRDRVLRLSARGIGRSRPPRRSTRTGSPSSLRPARPRRPRA